MCQKQFSPVTFQMKAQSKNLTFSHNDSQEAYGHDKQNTQQVQAQSKPAISGQVHITGSCVAVLVNVVETQETFFTDKGSDGPQALQGIG